MKPMISFLVVTCGLILCFSATLGRTAELVDFNTQVKPVLETACLGCHCESHAKGNLRLDTRQEAFKVANTIVSGHADQSRLYITTAVAATDEALMPPVTKEGPLPQTQIDLIKRWIDQGAPWPAGILLRPRPRGDQMSDAERRVFDRLASEEVYNRLVALNPPISEAPMKPYSVTIPGSDVSFDMVPVLGGGVVMGSPDTEPGRKPDEGPRHCVKVSPFWMGKCLVTWNEYELFQFWKEEKKLRVQHGSDAKADQAADQVSRPSRPYVDMTFGMGRDGYPAISMTQYAASQYCKWLSAKTGQFYRLPTEAEWEYACRAGTSTAYFWGDDPKAMDDYAWGDRNSGQTSQKVGRKKPNPWGLYDMCGLLWQWTLDELAPYQSTEATNPRVMPTKPYPHATRGGSWQDKPDRLRCAARRGSDRVWKMQDPQFPQSIWYHTDAQFVGFRIVRPLSLPPSVAAAHAYWNDGHER